MATPVQRLCLRVRSSGSSLGSQSRCLRLTRCFHTTRNFNKQISEEEEQSGRKQAISRSNKVKPLKPSQIDAPRSTSTRLLLEALGDEDEMDKILDEKEDSEYKQFVQQYGAAVSIDHPEAYDGFVRQNGFEEIRNLDPNRNHNAILRGDERYQQALSRYFRSLQTQKIKVPKKVPGFLASGEAKGEDKWPDEVFEADDITSVGHGYLEEHREIREYYRLAAWELPLLTQHAKDFKPPSGNTPLRFRYTSYMGEKHPAERKVVLEFCTADLPLEPKQRLKLVKLLGQRYNPQTDMAKMSCESFEEPQQNKRYLSDLVDNLLEEARLDSTAEGGKDTFKDIPADFRHVKWKKPPKFPDAWKMTPERREKLFQGWAAEVGRSQQALLADTVIDGQKTIAHMLGANSLPEQQPVRVA